MAPNVDAINLISVANQDPHETNKLERCRDIRELLFEPVLRHIKAQLNGAGMKMAEPAATTLSEATNH